MFNPSSNSKKIKSADPVSAPVAPIPLSLPVSTFLLHKPSWKAENVSDAVVKLSWDNKSKTDFQKTPATEVREEFLSLKTIADALRFFSLYGPMYGGHPESNLSMAWGRIQYDQQLIRCDRELTAKEFFTGMRDIETTFRRLSPGCQLGIYGAPYLSIRALTPWEAIRAINYVDQIRGAKVSSCRECGKQFALGTRPQSFCNLFCQRRWNKTEWNKKQALRGGENVKA